MGHALTRFGLAAALATSLAACASGGAPCAGRACDAGGSRIDVGAVDAPSGGDDASGDAGTSVDTGGSVDGGTTTVDAPVAIDAPVAPADAGGIVRCPPGEALVGRDADGPVCAPIDTAVTAYVNASCSIYFGWRDGCGACSDPPLKWGRVSDASCETTGVNGRCEVVTLGGASVRLYGLNTDGDVDDNDKLYVGFSCAAAAAGGPVAGNCPTGSFVTGTDAAGFVCAPIGTVAEDAIHDGCALHLGQRDSCSGCTTGPLEWGRVAGDTCSVGAGTGGTCSSAALGAANVTMFGLDLDGDVNDDDQLYLGLSCTAAPATETRVLGACPPGTIAIGIGGDGSLACTTPSTIVSSVGSECFVYFGWRDSCSACLGGPSKWGRTNANGTCDTGVGALNVCTATPAPMIGLNTDGDVDDDDVLYVGLHCF